MESVAATPVAKRGQDVPEKGTRPRNRKELILVAAAELFSERGYSRVSMSDIAAAVAIGPSALYRHYRSKQAMLVAVIEASTAAALTLVEYSRHNPEAESLDSWAALMAAQALDSRAFGVLWQREARHLPDEDRERLMGSIRSYRRAVAEVVARNHPDDEKWAATLANLGLSVFLSVSYHRVSLPRPQFQQLLAEMLLEVFLADPPETHGLVEGEAVGGAGGGADAGLPWRAAGQTRERLLGAAVELFAQRGFAEVGMEDIAEAVGIAGPSIYHHFSGKTDILVTALRRGAQSLRESADQSAGDASAALRAIMEAYVNLVATSPEYVTILVTELGHLPENQRAEIVAEQRYFVNRWVTLVQSLNPDMGLAEARIRVQAAITVINDRVRASHESMTASQHTELVGAAAALLHLRAG